MRLSRLLTAVPDARLVGHDELEIADIAYDSRRVTPGCLFVAVPSVGSHDDAGGLKFAQDAIARGATAVVVQAGPDLDGVATVHVDDVRSALGDLAAEYYDHPSRRLNVYAVTGTDGKSTTCYLLEQILSHGGYSTGLLGTVEIKIGGQRLPNLDRMTTPEALDVQRLLRSMCDAGVTHAAMEASSHALALRRLRGCSFAACALTNITGDHIEFHQTWERYFAAKASLFTEVAPDSPAVLNRDDEQYERMADLIRGRTVTYGFTSDADVRARDISAHGVGTRFVIETAEDSAVVNLPLAGAYNVSNALAASALGRLAGVPLVTIASALTSASAPPGRLERVTGGQPFDVVIDYAHTPNAFRSVLATVRDRTDGRVIVVFGAAGNRDRAKRPMLARIAQRFADIAIVTNEDPFGEEPESIIDEVLSGIPPGEHGTQFFRESDRGRAIVMAVREARAGDMVLILGKGHEQSIVVNGYKQPWSDALAAREALETLP